MSSLLRTTTFLKQYTLTLTALLLFLILLPFVLRIEFPQNDDWIYYQLVLRFLEGEFSLHPDLAATYYSQGILGALFSVFFSTTQLPLLTALVSVGNFVVFYHLLREFGIEHLFGLALSLLLFFNPLHFYSSLGFMSDNYFLFLVLLSLYFHYRYQRRGEKASFWAALLVALVSFFVRQSGLVLLAAYAISYLFSRSYKEVLSVAVLTIGLWFYYKGLFPQTVMMQGRRSISFNNLMNIHYSYTLVYASLIYLTAFVLPLIGILLLPLRMAQRKAWIVLGVYLCITFGSVYLWFSPHVNLWGVFPFNGHFPYFKNVFTQTGFFVDTVHGRHYHFSGYFDLFRWWGWVSLLLAPFLLFFLSRASERLSLPFLYIALSIFSFFLTSSVLDRYLLPLIPLTVLGIAPLLREFPFTKIKYLAALGFLVFLIGLNYQYASEFVLRQKYIWGSARTLVHEGADPGLINAGNAWGHLYVDDPTEHEDPDWRYVFSYEENDEELLAEGYKVVERKKISYPLNFYLKPYLYLYKRL